MRNINGSRRDKWKYTGGRTGRENYRENTTLTDYNNQYSAQCSVLYCIVSTLINNKVVQIQGFLNVEGEYLSCSMQLKCEEVDWTAYKTEVRVLPCLNAIRRDKNL